MPFLALPDKVKLEKLGALSKCGFLLLWLLMNHEVGDVGTSICGTFRGIMVENETLQCHLGHISWMVKIGCGCVSSVLWPTTWGCVWINKYILQP